jgi:hypothetical protein
MWVGSTMTMSIKVWKPSLIIFTCHQVWQGKRWKTSLSTCIVLSKTIIATISQNVLWATVRSLPHGHRSKWVPKSSMVWPHWHRERCIIIGYSKPRWVHSATRKWADDKQIVNVVKWINNQTIALELEHEREHARVIFERAFTRREANSCSCKRFAKEARN